MIKPPVNGKRSRKTLTTVVKNAANESVFVTRFTVLMTAQTGHGKAMLLLMISTLLKNLSKTSRRETMSNDVVISKKNLSTVIHFIESRSDKDNGPVNQLLDQLRAAPETVSLDGVDVRTLGNWWEGDVPGQSVGRQELMVRLSDLRRLVVQPSAVVSREVIEEGLSSWKDCFFAGTVDGWKSLMNEIERLQLPQPVAPVQSGGVYLSGMRRFSLVEDSTWYNCLQESVDGEYIQFSEIQRIVEFCINAIEESQPPETTPWDCVDAIRRKLANSPHLTTTQSAPSTKELPPEAYRAVSDNFHDLVATQSAPSVPSDWIPARDAPQSKPVLCKRGNRTFIGKLVGRFEMEMDTDAEEAGEWDEEGDNFYALPGWFEQAPEHDDVAWWAVESPEMWQPLPEPPTERMEPKP